MKIRFNIAVLLIILPFAELHGDGGREARADVDKTQQRLTVESIPDLPDSIGVAGPIVGVHNDALIVAGGANFAAPDDPQLWDVPKRYHDRVWLLRRTGTGENAVFDWQTDSHTLRLKLPIAYSAVVSTPVGVLSMGGEDSSGPTKRTLLLQVKTRADGTLGLFENDDAIPDLPLACTNGGAAIVGGYVYVVAGEVVDADGNRGASRIVWRLELGSIDPDSSLLPSATWQHVTPWPLDGPPRMYPIVTAQHDGFGTRLYVMGGRHFIDGKEQSDLRNLKFCADCWSLDPATYDADKSDAESGVFDGPSPWRRQTSAPVPITAGSAVAFGPAHVIVPNYATGDALGRFLDTGLTMKDFDHPGFPRQVLAYHTITDTWTTLGTLPAGQVTTQAIGWDNDIMLISGEVRPRVRTPQAWRMRVRRQRSDFGRLNTAVLIAYLLAVLGVGAFFTFRNKTTDDYFRGGKGMPWWAAGCSIFATMLSSITYMAIPAKAFAQDWVYALGSLMILAVAPIAIYVALPFFRRIDATSAYEYLERRFNRPVRWIGSGSFSLFHIFRMGVVLALASLALASATPWSPTECVVVMGTLSIVYCTLGGIEAVIWTDTLQTFILIGGAILCFVFAWVGSDPGSLSAAVDAGKFHLVILDFGPSSFATMAIWVVIFGGLGQNLASYTADQAVVQRYMTTPDSRRAAKSIWLNGLMAIPTAIIFFGLGTAFWMFYRCHPDQLDPVMATDRILPHFISQELPVGLAGLVVAGIFAAAQSTVSTSMNSGATTIVTDFMRPLNMCKTDRGYLWQARIITLAMGVLGTAAGFLFVDPKILSLFDQFIAVLGMFLGVLAGLFALGVTTRRATGPGSLVGAAVAILLMTFIFLASKDQVILGIHPREILESIFGFEIYMVSGYLYASVGISVCYVVGYVASLILPAAMKPTSGLTWWDPVEAGAASS